MRRLAAAALTASTIALALALPLVARAADKASGGPETVVVQSGALELHALLWRPDGHGPFPAVLFNHGSWPGRDTPSGRRPDSRILAQAAALGPVFAKHGYVFLAAVSRNSFRNESALHPLAPVYPWLEHPGPPWLESPGYLSQGFMKLLFAVFLVVHGLIHLMGTAKALGVAGIPQLTQQIDRPLGVLWLLAAALLVVTAIFLFTWPQWWWAVGAGALVVSQVVIVTSWADARYGTIANVIVLAGVALGFLSQGPWSFRAEYDREIARAWVEPSQHRYSQRSTSRRSRRWCSGTSASTAPWDSRGSRTSVRAFTGRSAAGRTHDGCPSAASSTTSTTSHRACSS